MMRSRNSFQQELGQKLRLKFLVNNPAIADGIVSGEFSLDVRSKGELNHRPDDWLDDWSNKNWLVDHPVADPGADIGTAQTALLAVGPEIGTAAEAIGFALKAAVG